MVLSLKKLTIMCTIGLVLLLGGITIIIYESVIPKDGSDFLHIINVIGFLFIMFGSKFYKYSSAKKGVLPKNLGWDLVGPT